MSKNNQPNIVYVMCDELRWCELACYGHPNMRTPNMDRLASEGVRFETAVSNCPVCMAARSVTLSGQYSRSSCGMQGNTSLHFKEGGGIMPQWPSPGRDHLPEKTLPESLKEAGYSTMAVGKWHVENWPDVIGFDHYVIPAHQHANSAQWYCEDGNDVFSPDGYGLDFEAEHVSQLLKDRKTDGKPFYLYYNMCPPHMPLMDAPRKYLEMYGRDDVVVRGNVDLNKRLENQDDKFLTYLWDYRFYRDQLPYACKLKDGFDLVDLTALYMGLTTWVDDALGKLLDDLDQTGLAENTIVVFTADHGDNLGSWGKMGKSLWRDESARIPMMMRGPGISKGIVSHQVASLVDMAPTFLSLADVPIPSHFQGQNLADVVTGKVTTLEQNYAIIESGAQGVAIRTPEYVMGRHWLADTNHRKIEDQVGECFNMTADPFSLNNLAGTSAMPEDWQDLNRIISDFHENTPWLDLPPFRFGRHTA